jgi:hypothetical protein
MSPCIEKWRGAWSLPLHPLACPRHRGAETIDRSGAGSRPQKSAFGDDISRVAGYSGAQFGRRVPIVDMSLNEFRLASCLVLALGISACVIVPDQRHYAGGLVMVAPPPPREEVVGTAPEPGYVWLSGYWAWVGDRHEWVPGHWSASRPGRHWVTHQWVREGDGWRMKPGHWARS